MAFAEKAQARIDEYVEDSNILVLASHNNSILYKFCNKAILLDSGHIRHIGSIDEVLREYGNIT
jgi:ABC-type polysaccharide/polyol phosphate transport system ATPase subunit